MNTIKDETIYDMKYSFRDERDNAEMKE